MQKPLKKPLKLLLIVTVALIVLLGLAVGTAYIYVNRELAALERQFLDAADATAAAPAVRADAEALASVTVLRSADRADPASTADKDAGVFFNDRIAWTSYAPGQDGRDGTFDPSWWTELARFDHWDLESGASPLGTLRAADPLANPATTPLPIFKSLTDAAVARLAEAASSDDPVARVIQVQKLASLLLTTESLVGIQVGLSLHSKVLEARKALAAKGATDAAAFVPDLTEDQIARAKRLAWGMVGMMRVGVAQDTRNQLFPPGAVPFGTCAALAEAVPSRHLERAMLEPYYEEAFANLGMLVDRLLPMCRLRGMKRYWADRSGVPAALRGNLFAMASLSDLPAGDRPAVKELEGDAGPVGWAEVKEWPLVRRWLGLVLATVGSPTFLKDYLKDS